MFEDGEWRSYFWTALPTKNDSGPEIPIASALMSALGDLLFCPNFTVAPLAGSQVCSALKPDALIGV